MPLDPTAIIKPYSPVVSRDNSLLLMYPKKILVSWLEIRALEIKHSPVIYVAVPIETVDTTIRQRSAGIEVYCEYNRRQP